jgi:hypothetical protein
MDMVVVYYLRGEEGRRRVVDTRDGSGSGGDKKI